MTSLPLPEHRSSFCCSLLSEPERQQPEQIDIHIRDQKLTYIGFVFSREKAQDKHHALHYSTTQILQMLCLL